MTLKKDKCIIDEADQLQLAISLVNSFARLQVLEIETTLSRRRLITLYRELHGVSPPKGQLPFSTRWFLIWTHNIHASLFLQILRKIEAHSGLTGILAMVKAYQLYQEHVPPEPGQEPLFSLTRAWTLVRFLNGSMLSTSACRSCKGVFLVKPNGGYRFICGLCKVPARAGKTDKARDAGSPATQSEG